MDTKISEEDLLSGVELLPTTEPNTPNNIHLTTSKLQNSSISMLSGTSSPTKSVTYTSPTKCSSAAQSFSDTAFQVQKRLHDSLASSLRKEVEIKANWQASPGEVCMRNFQKSASNPEKSVGILTEEFQDSDLGTNQTSKSVLGRTKFLTLPQVTDAVFSESQVHEETKENVLPNAETGTAHCGPNICLSDKFPPDLSPIKHCEEKCNQSSALKSHSNDLQAFGEDPNTKKLLAYIQKLEKGPKASESLADRLNQLSFLLKNSSLNQGKEETTTATLVTDIAKSVTEVTTENMLEENQRPVSKPTFASTKPDQKGKSVKPLSHKTGLTKKTHQGKDGSATHHSKSGKVSARTISAKTTQSMKQESTNRHNRPTLKSSKSKTDKTHQSIPSTNPSHEQGNSNLTTKSSSHVVREMDEVRSHLHTMLNLHKVNPLALDLSTNFDPHRTAQDSKEEDTFRSNDTTSLLRARPSQVITESPRKDVSEDLTDSLTSGLFSILRTGHNKQPSSERSSIDSSLAAENGVLRDTLEKETYRRKHCEKQIQKLQKKMLDVQQELAVAHSTDRKKDLMIEQLDKTLAKVVDGWKSHEANLAKSVEQLTHEKEKNKEEIVKLKEMLVNLENELAKVLEELVDEKERYLQLEEKEKSLQISYQSRAEEISKIIDQKNENLHQIQRKNEELIVEKKCLQQTVDDLAQSCEDQKKAFVEKEAQWEEAVIEIEKKQKELLQNEKNLTENERKRCSNVQSTLVSTEEEVQRLKGLMDALKHEMASMQTQEAVTESKHQTDLRKLEAEHKINVERQIMEKLSQVHHDSQNNEARIREAHKKQVLELMESHKRELESQCRRYEDELQKRDENLRRTIASHEMSMNQKLKVKSEDMKKQMLSKMQNLLQTQYNENLDGVGYTPGVTPQRAPASSQQSGVHIPHNASFKASAAYNTSKQYHSVPSFRQSYPEIVSSFQQVRPSVAKPTPTLSTMDQQVSAFTLPSSVAPPHVSSFQPVEMLSASNPQGTTHSQMTDHYHQDQFPVPVNSVIEDSEAEEGVLPNLSLISSISHSTTTSMQHNQQSMAGTEMQSRSSHAKSVNALSSDAVQTVPSNINNLSQNYAAKPDEEAFRQMQLQHYVQMLLQRSPGDPVNTSVSASTTEVAKIIDDDKENTEVALPVTSYPVAQRTLLNQALNQHMEASPDLVPVKQHVMAQAFNQTSAVNKVTVSMKTKNNPAEAKPTKPNVHFADDVSRVRLSSAINATKTMTPTTFLNPSQMSEISQLLGLYSTSDTPSGETRLAAEQLLNYLRETSKSSIQPSVTSSPVKNQKQHSKTTDSSLALSGGKARSKNEASPSKAHPAWR